MQRLIPFLYLALSLACTKPPDDVATTTTTLPASSRYLYVASGACYSGGNATFSNTTSSNLIFRLNTDTGARDAIIADYNASPAQAGDSPVGIVNIDSTHLYVAIENTTTVGARRIERVEKIANGNRTSFSNNITAMSAQLRALAITSGGDLLISKSTAIEKLTTANVRILNGANPFINAPAGAASVCGTNTTIMSKVLTLSNGKVLFFHAAAGQTRFGILPAAGYAAAADCTAGQVQATPVAAALPVAAVYDSTNAKLIVAWGGVTTATDVNSIYAYSINETTNAITSPQKIYDANLWPGTYAHLLYGVSEMALDSTTSSIYIATAISTATTVVNYAIEKFTYDSTRIGVSNTTVLTRVGSVPFYQYGLDTKCIPSMMIAN